MAAAQQFGASVAPMLLRRPRNHSRVQPKWGLHLCTIVIGRVDNKMGNMDNFTLDLKRGTAVVKETGVDSINQHQITAKKRGAISVFLFKYYQMNENGFLPC